MAKPRVSAFSKIELLPLEFRKRIPDEDAASAGLWHAWLTRRDRAAFNALAVQYLPLAIEDDSDPHDGPMIDPDLLRRVAKGLDKRDRRILRMTLRGLCPAEIARKLGVSRERGWQLVNGLLWTLRANTQLAAAMGVEAIDRPRGCRGKLPRIQTLGQARLAM